jgi:hypothetical protein
VSLGYFAAVVALFASTRPVLSSHWWGDDWPNSQSPYWNVYRYGENSLDRIISSALNAIEGWMYGQGRFFPLAGLEGTLLFNYFSDLESYKQIQFGLMLLVLIVAVWFVYVLSRSHRLAIIFGLVLAVTVQFRRDFDPHLGFSLLVPSMTLKLLLSSILFYFAVTTRQFVRCLACCILGSVLYFAAMSTYEHAFVLLGVPMATMLAGYRLERNIRQTVVALASLMIAWLFYFWIVFVYLRGQVESVIPRYQLQANEKSVWIFVSQLVAPLPLSVFKGALDLRNNPDWVIAFVTGVFLFLILIRVSILRDRSDSNVIAKHRQISFNWEVGVVGLCLLVLPGLLLALRPLSYEGSRFTTLQPQLTYLHIFISQIGMAILLALIFNKVLNRETPKNICRPRTVFAIIYVTVLILTSSHNYAVARDTRNRELHFESWHALHRDRYLFEEMRDGDGVITQTNNFAYETNPANFYVQSGIRLSGMFYPPYMFSETELTCAKAGECEWPDLRQRIAGQLANGLVADSEEKYEKLRRGAQPLDKGDWIFQSLQPEKLASSRLWIFDLYPVTAETFIAFSSPLVSDQLEIEPRGLRYVQLARIVTDGKIQRLKPSLAGVCLVEVIEEAKVVGPSRYPLSMTVWKFPDNIRRLSYFDLGWGAC